HQIGIQLDSGELGENQCRQCHAQYVLVGTHNDSWRNWAQGRHEPPQQERSDYDNNHRLNLVPRTTGFAISPM
ncbi:MAG: hypothetical protein RLY19_426, partial [Actinomycetota bacterium]